MINRFSIFFLIALTLPHLAVSEIRSWQDDKGTSTFGDEPINMPSHPIELLQTNTFSSSQINDSNKKNHVTLYTTSWCGFCRKARHYFKENGIKFIEYDVEKNVQATATKKRLDKKYRHNGVPLAIINGTAIYGYKPKDYQTLLNQ